MWHFAVSVLPGLLQTPGYARELLSVGGLREPEFTQQVEARTGRRELLDGKDAPPFRVILSEEVPRIPMQDADGRREQLVYLLDMSERQNVTLHALPHRSGCTTWSAPP